jgi:hypothetical protein
VAAAADAVSRRDLGAFRQEWRRVLPTAADLLERVSSFDDLLVNTVSRVDCRRWFSGRLVLLGDAAHAMPPNLGQGANSALVDGVILAEELTSAASVENALVAYDKRRRPLARRVQKTAEMLQRLCGVQRVPAVRVRDALLAGLARFPRLSEEAIRRSLADDVRAIRSASCQRRPLSDHRERSSFASTSPAPVDDRHTGLESTGWSSGCAQGAAWQSWSWCYWSWQRSLDKDACRWLGL